MIDHLIAMKNLRKVEMPRAKLTRADRIRLKRARPEVIQTSGYSEILDED
ncbi:hypothetical protein [Anatilimnocola floriformis]|nr:hypothetical protein [Anatilimnocola floriformis]